MNTTHTADSQAVAGQVERTVRPRAWAIFVDSGNARMWTTLQPHVQKLADAEGLTVTPLYDQASLDAAVAAERAAWDAVQQSHQRLVLALDVALNGADRAAPQASLCDLVSQVQRMVSEGLIVGA